ncbi:MULTISPECIES: ACP S-malonyltransferase [Kosmotoga]|jgi:[acyl-carrier-protein] S-malonyltransferase|uniref:Malonyl CoA-acyl carrier protein transacylase n=1 Tax=Kosmotoga olearia (strain ATCC BAA-1733 / DSM 21960 / TBF 19.5.1) TaxID=521045 RepID=C5CH14_KOSOT|nr:MULTISPECIES: ACP S-malonyltransferase [Kosmotoga]ACR79679.1 malonyl CoA-acyl carrier protein transacylase [Kosmotoga olearia TBF 19.5.1]MDK2953661.1 [acyl-carrier-protein] S-malonyltransferase [Kosmotoga sp.]OAA21918.1 ACP S-malonyltransferase [Kosmotoga sp. DU53]
MNAWIFAGQGSQYVGMGKELYKRYQTAKNILEQANDILGFDILKLMFEGPQDQLTLTENAQPAILAHSFAIAQVLEEMGVKCNITAGFSLGEITALTVSGVLSYEDALKLAHLRGKAMQSQVPEGVGSMAAVIGVDSKKAEEICNEISPEGDLVVANYNCPGQVTISGLKELVEKAVERFKNEGARKVVPLRVSAPFHTKFLKPVGDTLLDFLNTINVSVPKIPVISNVTTEPYPDDTKKIKELVALQAYSPVKWEQSINTMLGMGVEKFIEIGPGKTLTGFMRRINRNSFAKSTDGTDLEELARELADT